MLSKNVDAVPLYGNALTLAYTKSISKERFGLVWEVPCTTVTGNSFFFTHRQQQLIITIMIYTMLSFLL